MRQPDSDLTSVKATALRELRRLELRPSFRRVLSGGGLVHGRQMFIVAARSWRTIGGVGVAHFLSDADRNWATDLVYHARQSGARTGFKWIALLLMVLGQTLNPSEVRTTFALTNAGFVTELQGIAKLSRQNKELDVVLRMAVLLRDRLHTMVNSHLTVTLNGGSKLMLAESSTMLIDDTDGHPSSRTAVSLLLGHLRAVVHPIANSQKNFEVHTPNAVIGVRGTEFEIAFIDGKPCPGFPSCLRYTEVDVYEGVVEVRNPLNPAAAPVIVRHGYSTNVPCELAPTSAAPIGMNELGTPGYH